MSILQHLFEICKVKLTQKRANNSSQQWHNEFNIPFLKWMVTQFKTLVVLFQNISIPLPHTSVFGFNSNLTHPSGTSSSATYVPLKILSFEIPHPLGNFQWPSMGRVWIFSAVTQCLSDYILTITVHTALIISLVPIFYILRFTNYGHARQFPLQNLWKIQISSFVTGECV